MRVTDREECNGTEVITMEWNELQAGRQEAKRLTIMLHIESGMKENNDAVSM